VNTNIFYLARKSYSLVNSRFSDYKEAASVMHMYDKKLSNIENGKLNPNNFDAALIAKEYHNICLAKQYCAECPMSKFILSSESKL
jgi:hypothetical protein